VLLPGALRIIAQGGHAAGHIAPEVAQRGQRFVEELAAALPDDWRKFCATGFRDTTRVAAGDPALWAAIFRDNREGVLDALDRLTGQLTAFRHALETDDVATLMDLLIRGKENRDALGT